MKNIFIPVMVFLLLMLAACKDKAKKDSGNTGTKTDTLQSPADSLMAAVMDGHDVGMAKMSKLNAAENEVQRILDSIAMLPRKTKIALQPFKVKMDTLLADLKSAKSGMEKWMSEFNMDSSMNDAKQRIRYLTEEKQKVSVVKENILRGLHRADSLIKTKL